MGPDDQEAYRRQQIGLESQGSDWVTMHRDLGRDEDLGDGHIYAKGSSDLAFRNQYRAWKNYMMEGGRSDG